MSMKALCTCGCCGEEMENGDRYYEINGEAVCKYCVDSMSVGELLDTLHITCEDIMEMCGISEKKVGEAC